MTQARADDRFSAAPTALGSSSIDFPALPGWADVWAVGPPGLASMAIFCRVISPSEFAAGKWAEGGKNRSGTPL